MNWRNYFVSDTIIDYYNEVKIRYLEEVKRDHYKEAHDYRIMLSTIQTLMDKLGIDEFYIEMKGE